MRIETGVICQNPLLASNFEKTLAPASWESVSSTFGSGWTSLSTFWLSGLRSTQIRTLPDFLGTTTIPAHHGVGSDTLEITPVFSVLSSSSATLGRRGKGTCCGVKSACGLVSGRSQMWYSLARVPRSWKTFVNFFWTLSAVVGVPTESILTARYKSVVAGSPSRLVVRWSTTKAWCLASLSL